MRITYVKTDHGLPKLGQGTEIKKWTLITEVNRSSTLCSISAFIISVILAVYLILDYIQYLIIQPKKETPDLRGNTTQVNIASYLITHAVGLCLAAFAYGSAVVERNTSKRIEQLIFYSTF